MNRIVVVIFILAVVLLVVWRVYQLKKTIANQITGETILNQVRYPFPWLKIIFSILLFAFYYAFPKSTASFGMATLIVIISLTDYLVMRKVNLVSHAITGEVLLQNGFEQSTFDLSHITRVEYNLLLDYFEINSQDGESVVFHRRKYQNESLLNFIKSGISRSHLPVVISQKAQDKLYSY